MADTDMNTDAREDAVEASEEASETPVDSGVTDAVSSAPGIDWDALDACLAAAASAATLPSYRRIWFSSLIRQGREAESSGRAALAAHCRARLEQEFTAFGISTSSIEAFTRGAAASESPERAETRGSGTRAPGEMTSGSHDASAASFASAAGTARAAKPETGTTSSPRAPSPLEALAVRRDAAARARLRELLDRHASRLSPDEAAAFAQALAASPEAGGKTSAAAGGAPAASIADMRRRLVDRLMRAARYRRQAARLAAWTPAPPPGVSGPYNDYRTLEDMLHRIAVANPHAAEWAAEFFDIYAEMRAVRQAYGTLLQGK